MIIDTLIVNGKIITLRAYSTDGTFTAAYFNVCIDGKPIFNEFEIVDLKSALNAFNSAVLLA